MVKSAKPSIILIFVDCLRPDHLSCYGYPKNTSPNIDRFAKDAMLFENCFSHAPDTRLSYASILTGFLPHETRLMENIMLSAEVETLPEILRQLGYKTVGVVSNYLLRRNRGWEQGFMIYDDTMDQCELVRQWPERIAEHTTDRAIELIKQFHQDQLFMWIHYQDPHGPYTPPGPFTHMFRNPDQKHQILKINRSLSGHGGIPSYQNLGVNPDFYYYLSQYDGEIAYQDKHLGRLIDVLKEFSLYEDALIIFSSDHGEGMGEHNYYFAHGENLYSSLIRVPLIIKYGKQLKGKRTDFVQHIDIIPTIFNILGFKMNPYFRGHDLREKYAEVKEIFSEMNSFIVKDRIKFSLISDGLKLLYTPFYQKYQLFDLKIDPYEKNDLINKPKYKQQVETLKLRLHSIRKQDFLGISLMPNPPHITDEEKEKLKSLGYVQY
jgi:arylsulfatase A-like enzyme